MHELWRGNANAWECDELGHLNVRAYAARAMEAAADLAERLGMHEAGSPRATAILSPRRMHVRFSAEVRPGAPLVIDGAVTGRGEHWIEAALVMRNAATGNVSAGFRLILDHMSPRSRRVFPFPRRFDSAFEALSAEAPPETAPRGLPWEPPGVTPTPAQAVSMGFETTGRGRIRAGDVDVFGRMRPELLLGKVSDSAVHFSRGFPELWAAHAAGDASSVGVALLECRIDAYAYPREGDGYVMRSGLMEAGAKVRRLIHWLHDPATGAPLWSVEGVACGMDLQRRALLPASDATLAALESAVIPGLDGRA